MAYSDTLNGIGLMFGGLLIPAIALYLIGDGSMMHGMKTVYDFAPDKLNIHFVHLWEIEFVLNFIIMLLVSRIYFTGDHAEETIGKTDKSWALVNVYGAILIGLAILIYVLLS